SRAPRMPPHRSFGAPARTPSNLVLPSARTPAPKQAQQKAQRPMKFAGWLNLSPAWPHVLDQAKHLDETGWDAIYVADHFMPGGPENLAPIQECWTTLAALAASTSNVRLGSLVTGNTYRPPPVLAKMAAQVDIISGG